jgi:hypothetical protein
MGVSLHYSADRDTPLNATERADLDRIVDEGETALHEYARDLLPAWVRDGEVSDPDLTPGELFEPLGPYSVGEGPGRLFAGASKISHSASGPGPQMAQLDHYLAAITRLRAVFPDARWHVHIDGLDIPWVNGKYDLSAAG